MDGVLYIHLIILMKWLKWLWSASVRFASAVWEAARINLKHTEDVVFKDLKKKAQQAKSGLFRSLSAVVFH